ncbi:unnamed protein product [Rotaria magnacalcarata]|uniref:Protein YIPF n=3 Tax=Rotaria magnacalcarata TaxID=392030 RepID=A0A819RJ82_9BILA|nr:unnamed protein product [Rotaria magnacalcarata]CAF2046463.1 unnamed protein product [Rotaria magnacalcarata]CAF4045145.1 unnamed protein product [Rotaria magnacalcarata]CAF4045160.1 unnamed protein product [Rotaria magnacalcarata]
MHLFYVLPVTTSNTPNEQMHIWQIEHYQKYFDIDTQQALERLLSSITPQQNKSYFNSTIRHNPDLYGPFWICATFIVTVAIGGNIVTYFHSPNADFQIDFSKIALSAIVTNLCLLVVNVNIYFFFFRYYIKRNEYAFLELLCIYGYRLTIFIPVSILWIMPIAWLQWVLTIIASLISASVLIVTLWPAVNFGRKHLSALSMLAVLFVHSMMVVCIMLVFFHISDKNIDFTQEITTLTTMASSAKSNV